MNKVDTNPFNTIDTEETHKSTDERYEGHNDDIKYSKDNIYGED